MSLDYPGRTEFDVMLNTLSVLDSSATRNPDPLISRADGSASAPLDIPAQSAAQAEPCLTVSSGGLLRIHNDRKSDFMLIDLFPAVQAGLPLPEPFITLSNGAVVRVRITHESRGIWLARERDYDPGRPLGEGATAELAVEDLRIELESKL